MRCRCGNEIKNVPEHLQGLADWRCQACANMAPGANRMDYGEEKRKREATVDQHERAA